MGAIQCFFLVPTDTERVWFRRYHPSDDKALRCVHSSWSYHNARTFIEDRPYRNEPVITQRENVPDNWRDPRWPRQCENCDYEFVDGDYWQVFTSRLFKRTDNGDLMPLSDAAPGAMWFAWWHNHDGSPHHIKRGGGAHLVVALPKGHHWDLDQKANNCDGWKWNGYPPKITANPGAQFGDVRVRLKDGVLHEW